MKLICPNDPSHDEFAVTAHVTEQWIVDANNDYMRKAMDKTCDVVHRPDDDDLYTCARCGGEAKKEKKYEQ